MWRIVILLLIILIALIIIVNRRTLYRGGSHDLTRIVKGIKDGKIEHKVAQLSMEDKEPSDTKEHHDAAYAQIKKLTDQSDGKPVKPTKLKDTRGCIYKTDQKWFLIENRILIPNTPTYDRILKLAEDLYAEHGAGMIILRKPLPPPGIWPMYDVSIAAIEPNVTGGADTDVPPGVSTSSPSGAPSTDPLPPFPWKNYSEQDVRERFARLQKVEYPIVKCVPYRIPNTRSIALSDVKYKPLNSFVCVATGEKDYENYGDLSDYFIEKQRMSGNRRGKLSILDVWHKRPDEVRKIAQDLVKAGLLHGTPVSTTKEGKHQAELASRRDTLVSLTAQDYRNALYLKSYELTNFKPSLVVSLAKYFNARRMLDISSGWGDRLIGFSASRAAGQLEYYEGSDPNPNMHSGYAAIKKFFDVPDSAAVIHESPFEDAPIRGRDFDFMFTSIPYFDLEIYDSGVGQSVFGKRGVMDWYNGFVLPSMNKCWDLMAPGGWILLNYEDTTTPTVTDKLIKDFHPEAYKGVIGYARLGKPMYPSAKQAPLDASLPSPSEKHGKPNYSKKFHSKKADELYEFAPSGGAVRIILVWRKPKISPHTPSLPNSTTEK